ncbi:hypothetical protein D8L93_08780 [Sodalis-like symbiont of Bactericera trigonica]|nr:hypothetical protein D8L93_08780 [Sodalis-like symbiont of Bactericera trigonica]
MLLKCAYSLLRLNICQPLPTQAILRKTDNVLALFYREIVVFGANTMNVQQRGRRRDALVQYNDFVLQTYPVIQMHQPLLIEMLETGVKPAWYCC